VTDPRPLPQYGEYATPEEQRAAIKQPPPEPVVAPEKASPARHPHPPTGPATTVAARPTRLADRIITIALLTYGLLTVMGAAPQMVDFTGFAETWMQVAGVEGEFTNISAGNAWGIAAACIFIGGWLLTAFLSWLSLSRRRVTWWIPLVGAIVTFLIVSVCLAVPMVGDPAVSAYFMS
jgi:hypothetical protein